MFPPRPVPPAAAILLATLVAGTGRHAPITPLPPTFHFDYDILPILERQGCASAYCHGSAKGRGGFKLSLFGSDPQADYRAITRDLDGRRLDLRDAANSLVLQKPSRTLPHEGGLRLPKDGDEYQRMREWIAAGAPYAGEAAGAVKITGLELTRDGNRLVARATLDLGGEETVRDVTDLATFSCSDEQVCMVQGDGRIRVVGPGEAWVFGRYAGRHARIAVRQPYRNTRPEPARVAADHVLDRAWLDRLAELGLSPSPRASDAQLVRRLYLDLVDRPPSPAELRRFQKLPPDRRIRDTAARLVERDEFAQRWGRLLADWLEVPDPVHDDSPAPRRALHERLRRDITAEVQQKKSLRQVAGSFLSGQHQVVQRFGDPRDRAEFVGRAFLGTRIGCARCHNHPLDRWQQDDHLAFSAWFADRRPDPRGGFREGILFHPETDEPVPPRLLPTTDRQPPADADHAGVVRWYVLSAASDAFHRNMANRIFAALCARGLVEPLDDHRLSNPASHESLLDLLAVELERRDLRGLVQLIVTSRLYQQDSRPETDEKLVQPEIRFFAVREARPLSSATFENAVRHVVGIEIPEHLPESPLARQLALLNGRFLHDALERPNNVSAILDFSKTPLDDIFELVLSRRPTAAETGRFGPLLAVQDQGSRAANARDLAFALLVSREFGSNR